LIYLAVIVLPVPAFDAFADITLLGWLLRETLLEEEEDAGFLGLVVVVLVIVVVVPLN